MKIENTDLSDVKVIIPQVFGDSRGWFYESYTRQKLSDMGLDMEFIQDNHSLSVPMYTLRGIHFQNNPAAQSKLVRCIRGRIWDVAVDLRKGSATYLQWTAEELSAENRKQLFIPRGFGHGFLTLEKNCEVCYKVDNIYSKSDDRSIRYDDPTISIKWPFEQDPILSEKDRNAPFLSESDCNFSLWVNT